MAKRPKFTDSETTLQIKGNRLILFTREYPDGTVYLSLSGENEYKNRKHRFPVSYTCDIIAAPTRDAAVAYLIHDFEELLAKDWQETETPAFGHR